MDENEVKELVDGFRDYLAGTMANLTAEAYANDARLMLASIGNDIGSMTHANVKKYVEYGGHDERSTPATQRRHRASMKAFAKYIKSERKDIRIAQDACENIKTQRLGRRIPECLTTRETNALLEAVGDGMSPTGDDYSPVGLRNRAMTEVMYSSGLRVDELIHLRIGDVAFGDGCGKMRIIGKGNKERIALVNDRAMEWLKRYMEKARLSLTQDKGLNSLVFTSVTGRPLGRMEVWRFLNKAALKAGIDPKKVHPHVLRHSFATHLLGGGANLMVIKELMGHASIATTQMYLTVNDRDKMDAYMKAFPKLG